MSLITKSRWRMLGVGLACTLAGAAMGGAAVAYQGHMQNALADLQAAQQQLSMATHNKGGHRDAAMNLISQAIGEVKAGIAVGAD